MENGAAGEVIECHPDSREQMSSVPSPAGPPRPMAGSPIMGLMLPRFTGAAVSVAYASRVFHEQFHPVARCENHLCNFLRLRQIADVTAEQADLLSVKGQSQVPGGAGIDDRSGRARLPSASRDKSEITITLSFVTGIGLVSSTTIAPQRQPATWSAAWPW